MPASKTNDGIVAAVVDPWGNGKERILATVNRRVDVLEMERSHGRISEDAYRAGRTVQATFEKLGTLPSSKWDMTPGDRFTAQASLIEQAMDRAGSAKGLVLDIESRIGPFDSRLLRRILGDRLGFDECAALQGKSGDRGTRYVAERFRDALEQLAESWAARGGITPPPPRDKHAVSAREASRRQAAAIAGGATLERLEGELADLVGLKVKMAEARREIVWLQERIRTIRQAQAENALER